MAKVLALVTFKIYPAEMGGQKGVADFYHHLKEHHDVVLAVSDNNPKGQPGMHPILFPNKKIYKNLLHVDRITQLAKEEKVDVVIAEHSYPGWLARLVAKRIGVPFIIHSHNIEALRFKKMRRPWWKAYWLYEKWIHSKADHSFFISEADRVFAIDNFNLDPQKCTVVTYGVADPPEFNIGPDDRPIFLFNGSLDYLPNEEAVNVLIDKVNPILRNRIADHRILITGKGASQRLIRKMTGDENIDYLGYVPDLSSLFARASVFINPVLNDTGVKTKIIEAIGQHCTVVSTRAGATGIVAAVCGNKLRTTPDNNWEHFSEEIIKAAAEGKEPTPPEYFRYYLWRTIAKGAADTISKVTDDRLRQIND